MDGEESVVDAYYVVYEWIKGMDDRLVISLRLYDALVKLLSVVKESDRGLEGLEELVAKDE